MKFLKLIWQYRGFILGNVKREFQSKYRNSLLGVTWSVLNPLSMIVVYTVIFSQVMRAKLPGVDSQYAYSIYICAGILTWGLFADIILRSQNVFLDNANLIKKLNFPKICLPVTVIGSALVNFSIIFSLFTIFLIVSNDFPGLPYFALIPILITMMILAIGLGIIVGVMNVFFRDVGQFFGIVLQFWFWLTPIIYPATILPESLHPLMKYNPMASIVDACQKILVHGVFPDWQGLIYPLCLGLVLCIIGLHLFRKHIGEMVDEL
ncbi:ABC transporter permease [Serratia proteamaculans]|uniref:ABC transporter permease n=1 Tax=Serratia proteamaculans TaxID=28151 RepID=UPI00217BA736|nr:ABC transporter permease [Serratia proteamaculans]CAI0899027.1 Polysialic acid transport protein kpsM [Serratia proteamaculans]CAI0960006.1 Polysialic acid transport protein kpsM [Serratia proteamaculans]CAI1871047.1 Polysialic acid transport protein kpsM [Serratia proteamaculans]